MLNIGDKVTVTIDDNCGYAKGHRGVITGTKEHEAGFAVYEIDDSGYEYSEDELEFTKEFKLGDEVVVNKGKNKGLNGTIKNIDTARNEYYIGYWEWFHESELTLDSKVESVPTKVESKIYFESTIPKELLKTTSETEPPNELQDTYDEITRLSVTIASLESELLGLYREVHRINKETP